MSVHLQEANFLLFTAAFCAHKIISFYKPKKQLRTEYNKQGSKKQLFRLKRTSFWSPH